MRWVIREIQVQTKRNGPCGVACRFGLRENRGKWRGKLTLWLKFVRMGLQKHEELFLVNCGMLRNILKSCFKIFWSHHHQYIENLPNTLPHFARKSVTSRHRMSDLLRNLSKKTADFVWVYDQGFMRTFLIVQPDPKTPPKLRHPVTVCGHRSFNETTDAARPDRCYQSFLAKTRRVKINIHKSKTYTRHVSYNFSRHIRPRIYIFMAIRHGWKMSRFSTPQEESKN